MADEFGNFQAGLHQSAQDPSPDLALFGSSDPLVGKILDGRWNVLKLLGEGSMSTVYQAEHLQSGEYVVLKILNQQISTNAANVKRFDATSREIIGLRHPRIAKFLDIHLDDRGSVFLVLENLPGESLEDMLAKSGHLPTYRTVEIFTQVCEALEYGHEDDVLHQDLKPSNIILLDNHKQKDEVKLVDYGVAKLLGDDSEDPRNSGYITRSKEVFGSPMYMSSEQCMGKKLDPRSDIYSLGCIMYETLTGKPPFVGKNVLETAYKQMNEPPKPLVADRSADKVLNRLQTVIFKALAKDPNERYQSISHMKSDLALMLSGTDEEWNTNTFALKKITKLKGKPAKNKKESSARAWFSFEAAVIAGVSLIIVLVVVAFSFSFLNPENTETVKFNDDSIWLANHTITQGEGSDYQIQQETAKSELTRAEKDTGTGSAEYAKATNTLVGVYQKNGHLPEATQYLKILVELYKKNGNERQLGETNKLLAMTYLNQNMLNEAEAAAKDSVEELERSKSLHTSLWVPLQILGDIYLQKKDLKKADEVYTKLHALTMEEKTVDQINFVMCEFRLADVYRREGKLKEAEAAFKDGIEICDTAIRQESIPEAKAYYCMGLTLAAANRNTDAEKYFKMAVGTLQRLSDSANGAGNVEFLKAAKKQCANIRWRTNFVGAIQDKLTGDNSIK
jgi:serine/threonine protein kinase